MRRRNSGFSILEIVIALAIVMLVLAAATTFFITTVRQYKIQTKIVETNLEGILGFELLRQDLESLGFGLPWDNNMAVTKDAEDAPLNAISGGPIAVASLDNPSLLTVNESDYLVIRSTSVGMGNAAGKWTTLQAGGNTRSWGSTEDDLDPNDLVIVLSPTLNKRTLDTSETGVRFSTVATYAPDDNLSVTRIVYGIDNVGTIGTDQLKFPWNRADYYIDKDLPTVVPEHCAPNTGVLVKKVVSQKNNSLSQPFPLLDCVADMQVIYGLDTTGNKMVNSWVDDISTLTADTIRAQLLEVRVHILAQEGQRDDSYTYPYDNVTVGSEGHGRTSFVFEDWGFTPSGNVTNNFKHYRWKVYNIVVKPRSLGN